LHLSFFIFNFWRIVSYNCLFDSECLTTAILNTASVAPCSRVSAAPKGTIDVTFSDTTKLQTVTIGIAAVAPNTQIQLTCKAIPTGGDSVAKTVK
jgi:hypothetical protein